MSAERIQQLTLANRALQEQLAEKNAENARLRYHLTELGKASDAAAMVIATIAAEDTTEEQMLQTVMDGIGTWAPSAILGTALPTEPIRSEEGTCYYPDNKEPSGAASLPDEVRIMSDDLRNIGCDKAADLLERLARENVELRGRPVPLTEWQKMEAELVELRAQIAALEKDAGRLDFVLQQQAFMNKTTTDAGVEVWQLWTQDEDENFLSISGDEFNSTPREAIDAAIAQQKEGGE